MGEKEKSSAWIDNRKLYFDVQGREEGKKFASDAPKHADIFSTTSSATFPFEMEKENPAHLHLCNCKPNVWSVVYYCLVPLGSERRTPRHCLLRPLLELEVAHKVN